MYAIRSYYESYTHDQAMLYTAVETAVPGLPLEAFADARVTHLDDDASHDWRMGVRWVVNPQDSIKLKLRAGYRNTRLDFEGDGVNVRNNFV